MFAFRQADTGAATQAIRLYGLRAKSDYVVTNVRTGDVLGTFSGRSLITDGLPVTLAADYSAAVLSVDPA